MSVLFDINVWGTTVANFAGDVMTTDAQLIDDLRQGSHIDDIPKGGRRWTKRHYEQRAFSALPSVIQRIRW